MVTFFRFVSDCAFMIAGFGFIGLAFGRPDAGVYIGIGISFLRLSSPKLDIWWCVR